ncbi:MAG: hypothetical protein HY290_21525 [Planctomycetia bacterium]|nr:hypothetical protein [Planctomycetia bacterium]
MTALLQIGLMNAAVAAVMACAVVLVSRKVRRPALTHALWILVLVKLVTPPMFEVPIEVPFELPGAVATADTPSDAATHAQESGANLPHAGEIASDHAASDVASAESNGTRGAAGALWSRASVALAPAGRWLARHVVAVIAGIWLLGSAAWFLLQGFTAYKFSQRLALATPAPAGIQFEADDLAEAMGLGHRPPVMIVRDVISPMLWGVGKNTRLLFPMNLLTRLQPGARATLIAHELAHYRRGDHWVRVFELIVSGIFWWNPVVWWARRQIEIAEEECCDAWVIEQFPETPRWYAEALLETIDFLSEAALVLPPAAAGAGHIPFLRQRLIAIMRGVAPQKMTHRARVAVLLTALAALPWHPGLTTARERSIAEAALEPAESGDDAENQPDAAAIAARFKAVTKSLDAELARASRALLPLVQRDQEWATAKSTDGRYSITRRGSDGAYLYDAVTNQQIDMSEYQILTVVFSPDGERFATGGADGTVRVWSSSTGALQKTFRGHNGEVHSVAFVQKGEDLISVDRDGLLKRWNIERESEQSVGASPHTPANCLAASPDGRWLAIGTGSWMKQDGGKIVVWDLATMETFAEFPSDVPVGVLMFKPDGKTLAAGDFRGRITFWDLASGTRLGATRPRYKNAVAAARFSVDTQALASVNPDDIEQEPDFTVPAPDPWDYERSASVQRAAGPLASGRPAPSGTGAVQQNSLDVKRLRGLQMQDDLRGLQMQIDRLERELQRAEQRPVRPASDSSSTN